LTNVDSLPTSSSHVKSAISQEVGETLTKTPPTLLTIPQELRDDIFKLVYATAVDADNPIGLHIVSTNKAGIESHEASPTTGATLLVCKQLHTKMREIQAAAVRQCWTTHRFHVNPGRARPAGLHLDIVSNRAMAHVSSFTFQTLGFPSLTLFAPTPGRAKVQVEFDKAYGWTASWDSSGLDLSWPQTFDRWLEIKRRLADKIDLLSKSRGGDGYLSSIIDPARGWGFTVDELDQLDASINE
jgi:hypothetical protein